MGSAASRILREASFFTPIGLDREPTGTFADRVPISLGPFTVTPYLVDHSAFDAYALQLEADGNCLFYTADLRGHGRKSSAFERLIADPPGEVGSLLLEGTAIGRSSASSVLSEQDVERELSRLAEHSAGIVLACYSPQNIDRLVSVYRASLRGGRTLVLDLYGAAVAEATERSTIPQADWERVRVYVPQSQRILVKRSGQFERVKRLGGSRIFLEELAKNPASWVLCFRASMAAELTRSGCLEGARAAWLMWPGYLDGESGHKTRAAFARLGVAPVEIHASGHASVEDLQRLAAAIDADRVVPIHTEAPQKYPRLFDRVTVHSNGEWWDV
jgi:ribonuclease J